MNSFVKHMFQNLSFVAAKSLWRNLYAGTFSVEKRLKNTEKTMKMNSKSNIKLIKFSLNA